MIGSFVRKFLPLTLCALALTSCSTSAIAEPHWPAIETSSKEVLGDASVFVPVGCAPFSQCHSAVENSTVAIYFFSDEHEAEALSRRFGTDGFRVGTYVLRFKSSTIATEEKIAYQGILEKVNSG